MIIEPAYVTFGQAKLLKEKGFNVEVFSYFKSKTSIWNQYPHYEQDPDDWNSVQYSGSWSRPEQWQVVEWLRVVHGINILPIENYRYPDSIMERWKYQIVNKQEKDRDIFNKKFYIESDFEFNSPQETYSAAFDYILNNNLI